MGLLEPKPGPIDVTVPGKKTRLRSGIRRHSTRNLPPAETTTRLRIPCTTVERVLIDLAATRSPELERAVEQAFVNRLIGRTCMQAALNRANGRAGTGELRRLLAGLLPQLPFTLRAGAPLLEAGRQRRPADADRQPPPGSAPRRLPLACFELIVETDGRGVHDNPYAFEEDRRRDLNLQLAGWHVIRFTWRQVAEEPERVLALVRTRLTAERSGR